MYIILHYVLLFLLYFSRYAVNSFQFSTTCPTYFSHILLTNLRSPADIQTWPTMNMSLCYWYWMVLYYGRIIYRLRRIMWGNVGLPAWDPSGSMPAIIYVEFRIWSIIYIMHNIYAYNICIIYAHNICL